VEIVDLMCATLQHKDTQNPFVLNALQLCCALSISIWSLSLFSVQTHQLSM